jgi:hypothetical protein
MYRCDLCGGVVPPRTECALVVTESRVKHYPRRAKLYPPKNPSDWKDPDKWRDDPGGIGWEAVREARACPSCAADAPGGKAR